MSATIHLQHDPVGQAASASRYAQAVETQPGMRFLHLSGQVGLDASGQVVATPEEQHATVWANALGLLAAADMGVEHIVRVNAYVVGHAEVARFRAARDRALGAARPGVP